MLDVKCANQINFNNKSKVLFVSHPHDFDLYFEQLSDEIIALKDCAVYRYRDGKIPSQEEWEFDVSEMNLITIPVTNLFLSEPNAALDIYMYAQEHKIPVLPIMMEMGLDSMFNSICGEIQYLYHGNYDPTAIPYTKKLNDFLSYVLIDNDLSEKIRNSFVASAFLSYRKMDRKYAQQLIKMIHANQSTRDVTVWYDEFIQPNEDFNESILEALVNSDLFLLAVTPNLVNEDNYVITKEYPAATNADKTILPIELQETNYQLLQKRFPGVPLCVNMNNQSELYDALSKSLPQIHERSNVNDALHSYYIGLAYLHGMHAELDVDMAILLLSEAAGSGSHEAARTLGNLYYQGTYIKRNFSQAIQWQKKQIEILEDKMSNNHSDETAIILAEAYRMLADMEMSCTSRNMIIDEIIDACQKALEICRSIHITDDELISKVTECMLDSLRHLAMAYETIGKYRLAMKCYIESLNIRKDISDSFEDKSGSGKVWYAWRIAQLYYDIGILLRKMGDVERARDAMGFSIQKYEHLAEISPDFLPYLANAHGALAYLVALTDVELAERHIQKSLQITEKLYQKNKTQFELYYANSLLQRAFILSRTGTSDCDEQINYCLKAETIYKKYLDSGSIDAIAKYINTLYRLACTYSKRFELEKARQFFERAIHVALENMGAFEDEMKLNTAHIFYDYGLFLITNTLSDDGFDLGKALEYLNKALIIFKSSGTNGENYVLETQHMIQIVTNIMHLHLDEGSSNLRQTNSHGTPVSTAVNCDPIELASIFMVYFNTGEQAENAQSYYAALKNYKEAEKYIPLLEGSSSEIILMKLGLYDRLAYCYEMDHNLVDAEHYYKAAAELSFAEAMKSEDTKIFEECINGLNKLISFYEDFNKGAEAAAYRKMLQEIREHIGGIVADRSYNVIDNEKAILELPDYAGNITTFRMFCTILCDYQWYAVFIPVSATILSRKSVLIFSMDMENDLDISLVSPSEEEKVYKMFKEKSKGHFTFTD